MQKNAPSLTLTTKQQRLVKASFRKVERISDIAALSFYQRLFVLDPSLRALFHADIEAQSKKLMQALKMVAEGIDRLPELLPAIESLGRRHLHYGVKDEHYATVGKALLWSLEQALGQDFTEEAAAWAAAFELLAITMKRAAATAGPVGDFAAASDPAKRRPEMVHP